MAHLPHALSLVIQQFSRLIYPALVLSGVLITFNKIAVNSVPTWAIAAAAITSIIPYHIGLAKLRYWQHTRKAARLGAILPPQWDGKAIGNRDLLALLDDAYFNGYLSNIWSHLADVPY